VLFLPTVLLAADAIGRLPRRGVAAALVGAMLLWGIVESPRLVPRDLLLASDADVAAIRWADAHLPASATVLIDVAPWMGMWRGVDGGWWLTPLTGRRTVLPPLPYGWGEPELGALVRVQAARASELAHTEPLLYCDALEMLMMETGARYYYTRSPRPLGCSTVATEYEQAGLRIYSLRDAASTHPRHRELHRRSQRT
jgi:hypothetical protein